MKDSEALKRGRDQVQRNIEMATGYRPETGEFYIDGFWYGRPWGDVGSIAAPNSLAPKISLEELDELRGRIDAVVEFAVKMALENQEDPNLIVHIREAQEAQPQNG